MLLLLAGVCIFAIFENRGDRQTNEKRKGTDYHPPRDSQPARDSLVEGEDVRIENQDFLHQRDAHANEAQKLREKSDSVGAIAATERALKYHNLARAGADEPSARLWELLGELHLEAENFPAHLNAQRKTLIVRSLLHGAKHWRATAAQGDLRTAETLLRLNQEQLEEKRQSDQLISQGRKTLTEDKSKEAIESARGAVTIRERLFGPKQRPTADALDLLVEALQSADRNYEAAQLYPRVLAVFAAALGDGHPELGKRYEEAGGLYLDLWEYAKAETALRRAAEIARAVHGPDHPDSANPLIGLGVVYRRQGEYAKSEPLYREALRVLEKSPDKQLQRAMVLNNLAVVYNCIGDDKRSEEMHQRAMAIRLKLLGPDDVSYGTSMNNLGMVYRSKGEYAKAEPLLHQASAIMKKAKGTKNPDYAHTLNNIAYVLQDAGKFKEAREHYLAAEKVWKVTIGERHPNYAICQHNLALVHQMLGEYESADRLFRVALELREKNIGKDSPEYVKSLNNYALLLFAQGRREEAIAKALEAQQTASGLIVRTGAVLSERQQLAQANTQREHLNGFLSISADEKLDASATYAPVLEWKGIVFILQRRQKELLRLSKGDGAISALVADLQEAARRFATMSASAPPPHRLNDWRKQLAALNERMEGLEADLAGKSAAFRERLGRDRFDVSTFLSLLPKRSALIDFVQYTRHIPDKEAKGGLRKEEHLAAFILRPEATVVRVELGQADSVFAAVERWRRSVLTYGGDGLGDAGIVLRKAVWSPLVKHLDGAETVLVAPDGAVARLPFAALPGEKADKFLIEERTIAILPVPRALPSILQGTSQPGDAGILVVGNVDYNASVDRSASGSSQIASSSHGKWAALDGTREEIGALASLFRSHFPKGHLKTLSGAEATEEAVRQEALRYRWLHVATHGYFAPPTMKPIGRTVAHDARVGEISLSSELAGYHPGLLSGLVLAGANHAPDETGDDGILTAVEVAALNLANCELAVLSACETGLGKSAGGEGLLGLQRAFHVAGAKSVVASLWSVPDQPTQVLMNRFYSNLWGKKLGKMESLREAQVWMLREGSRNATVQRGMIRRDVPLVEKSGRLPPYYWAAFVLSGDWR